jgi:hypothetical protein
MHLERTTVMPDLDRILVAEAHADADRWPANHDRKAFDIAFDGALHAVQVRRVRTAVLAVAAVAAAGVAAMSGLMNGWFGGQDHHSVRLAAYDHVLGSVPGDDGSVYVVGPKDEHTEGCAVVPDTAVTIEPSHLDPSAPGGRTAFAIGIKLPAGHANGPFFGTPVPRFFLPGRDHPSAHYYLFTCPTK